MNKNQTDTITIQTTVKKWGNSQAVRIPKEFLNILNLKENDEVELKIKDEALIMKRTKKYLNLRERMEQFYGKPIDEIFVESTQEVDTGAPTGNEFW